MSQVSIYRARLPAGARHLALGAFLFLDSCVALRANPQRAGLDTQLLEASLAAQGSVGAAVRLLETGETAILRGEVRFPMQSVYKLPIGMAALAAVDRGELELSTPLRVELEDLLPAEGHSPLRDSHPDGGVEVPLLELLRLSIAESDGTASDVLLRQVGGPAKVNAWLDAWGISGVVVADTERVIVEDWQAQYRNWATPAAALDLLKAVHEGRGLSPSSHTVLVDLMTKTSTGPGRIKGKLPPGTKVAHKTGTSRTKDGLTAATNDIGIVTLPDGRHLAVAVFVSDSKAPQQAREEVIASIARHAWDWWAPR
jgi:beta-lactamase class A